MINQNLRTVSLVVCTFAYLLIGAAVFEAIESANERAEKRRLQAEEDYYFRSLYNVSDDHFEKMAINIMRSAPYKDNEQWKFPGAFYFVTTVITTIGYGHSTPKTSVGKMVCLLYAVIGVPLNVIAFGSVGERINEFVTFLLVRIKRLVNRRIFSRRCRFMFSHPHNDGDITQGDLTVAVATMAVVLLVWGAWGFSYFEEWTYMDSFYYCVITLTTIGFGDFVAMNGNVSIQTTPEYGTFGLVFIFVGLAVLSSAINLIVSRLSAISVDCEIKMPSSGYDDDFEKPTSRLPAVLTINVSACPNVDANADDDCSGKSGEKRQRLMSFKQCNGLTDVNGNTWNGFVTDQFNCTVLCDRNQCCHL